MKTVFIDMDGVLADFDNAIPLDQRGKWDPPAMFEKGFFRNLAPMPGAKEAVAILMDDERLRVFVGSKPTTKSLICATEKYEWIAEHFPRLLKRIVLVCDKSLLRGDILVDDDYERWSGKFEGLFIHFKREHPIDAWQDVLLTISRFVHELPPDPPAMPDIVMIKEGYGVK